MHLVHQAFEILVGIVFLYFVFKFLKCKFYSCKLK
jgi:hypothetical protein